MERSKSPALAGERRRVTVMFADISGFTALSEQLDPEEVRHLVNACFERLCRPIVRYEGYVAKFIGDSVMAVFGAPVAHENDAERALLAALEMQTELEQFNAAHAGHTGRHFGLHFGINTGLVIAGGLGAEMNQQYDVIGDAVNLAARLEALSETGQILVGPETYQLTQALFEFQSLSAIRLKGKSEPVAVYELLAVKATPGSTRGVEGLSSPLVGREEELAQLEQVVAALPGGRGGVMAIVGDAGVGKSRLVAEVRATVTQATQAEDRPDWVEGRGLAHGTGMSYLLARDVLRNLLGAAAGVSPGNVARQLEAEMACLMSDRRLDLYPYLAHLLELPLENEMARRVRQLEGEALQRQMFRAVQALVRARAVERPLIMIWEDLHWADASSLSLLEALAAITADAPLLVITLNRPMREGRLNEFHRRVQQTCRRRYRRLALHPLNPEESRRLVTNLLPIDGLPAELGRLILDKAEGNPFYVEELIRSLLDSGAIVRQNGRFRISQQTEDIRIPNTLQDLIMARIDRLPPETRLTLQMASVIGRTFQHSVLAHLTD